MWSAYAYHEALVSSQELQRVWVAERYMDRATFHDFSMLSHLWGSAVLDQLVSLWPLNLRLGLSCAWELLQCRYRDHILQLCLLDIVRWCALNQRIGNSAEHPWGVPDEINRPGCCRFAYTTFNISFSRKPQQARFKWETNGDRLEGRSHDNQSWRQYAPFLIACCISGSAWKQISKDL